MKKNVLFAAFLMGALSVNAQDPITIGWKAMMHDPNYNFYEVCEAADKYFETHDKDTEGSGWKGYQRWKSANEGRYYPSGDRANVNPYLVSEAYQTFLQNNPTPKDLFPNGWEELGPVTVDSLTDGYSVGLGRIEDLYVNPNDANLMYFGTRSGGFWKTTDGGTTWQGGSTDFLPATGVNTLSVSPTNPDSILINLQNSRNQYSHGVYRSVDGGDTWTESNFNPTNVGLGGLGDNFRIYHVAYHPTVPNLVFIATGEGIFRSDDNLTTWTHMLTNAEVRDIAFHPTNPDIIYITDNRNSNGNRNYVYRSTDGGVSWSLSNEASGNGNVRAHIDVSASCPNCLFFGSSNGVWKSTDDGVNFTFISNPGEGAAFFGVNDQDEDEIYIGSIDIFTSTNGASSFQQRTWWWLGAAENGSGTLQQNFLNSPSYVHADPRVMISVNGVVYVGTDGYMVRTSDQGQTWDILNDNTGIREYYNLGVSQSNHYQTMVGSQDNGTSFTHENGWVEYYGADGMEAVIHPLNKDYMIGSVQYGIRRQTTNRGLSTNNVSPANESGSGNADWIAPLLLDPNNQFRVFHFSDEAWRSDDFGDNWFQLGGFTTFTNNQQADQAAIANNNSEIIVVSRASAIEKSIDGGLSFTDIKNGLPNSSIQDIAFDPNNDDMMIVVYNSYQNNGQKVYLTEDGGTSWTNITNNLGDMPVRSVVIDHSSASNIYIGAEIGVYTMPMGGNTWSLYNTDLPNVAVSELDICWGSNTLRASTWGRGLWEYALKDRVDYPAILTTEITNPPTFSLPMEDVDQYVTSTIDYDNTLTSVYVECSENTPTFGNVIPMSNSVGNEWVSDQPLPNPVEGTQMYFRVLVVGSNGDTTETYKFHYTVRNNPFLSLNELEQSNVILYPNPNSGAFQIELPDEIDRMDVQVISMDGRVVFEDQFEDLQIVNLDLNLANGNYAVVLSSKTLNGSYPLVIQRD
ncbi:MAG: hypothetical protein DCO96_04065 [Fluviicola sp. XM-24bin1]|nr:MAG: hypothetical protein DCO96_04065 [Fluviicola sp. XM-24bin1]